MKISDIDALWWSCVAERRAGPSRTSAGLGITQPVIAHRVRSPAQVCGAFARRADVAARARSATHARRGPACAVCPIAVLTHRLDRTAAQRAARCANSRRRSARCAPP
ncbi:hypothetical protein, partial [Burkholderia vietnamiensis]|uniref:hypothetical protein n=1 Tax=Burkholderia vietnamiensis TaxID=60552 RepID=UPI001CC333A4